MKVVFLADDFPPRSMGGAGFSTFELAWAVARKGHEVSVITTCRSPQEAGRSTYQGLAVYAIMSRDITRFRFWAALYRPRALKELRRILMHIRPDVVHANNVHLHLSWASIRLASRYAPVLWTARDVMAVSYGKLDTTRYLMQGDMHLSWLDNMKQRGLRYNPFYRPLVRYLLRSARARFAVSDALCAVLNANGIANVATIHTGIDASAWGAGAQAITTFATHLALTGRAVILFAGRASQGKGAHEALEALRAVVQEVPEALLLVAGPPETGIREAAGERGLEEHVAFTGWLTHEEMRVAYGAAALVWVPSVCFDSLPRTVLEAMAACRPVLGTTFGGAREAIEDGVTGFVVNPFHTQEWAEKSVTLLKDSDRAAAFGEAARERIRGSFSLDQYASRYLEVYEKSVYSDPL